MTDVAPTGSARGVDTFVLQDPTTMVLDRPSYGIFRGSLENTYQPYPSTSFSNSSIQFSIVTPGPTTVVDRRIYLGIPIMFTFTGDTGNPAIPLLNYGLTDSFKPYPVASMFTTIQANINNLALSIPSNDLFPWLYKYSTTQEEETRYNSQSPSFMDQSQTYEELFASNMNPMGGYPQSSLPGVTKRGDFLVFITENSSTRAVLKAFLIEPIPMAPFLFKYERDPGFYGVSNLTFNLTVDTNLSKIWSHMAHPTLNNAFTSVTASITGVNMPSGQNTPTIFIRYSTPTMTMPIDIPKYSPYYSLDRYPTAVGTVNPRDVFTVRSNNIQLNAIPKRMYILCRRTNESITYNTPMVCSGITNINVTFNNRTGLLSSASPYDLYQMAIANGYKGSLQQWTGYSGAFHFEVPDVHPDGTTFGAIAAVDFGQDIGLSLSESPGMAGTYQLQVTLTGYNPSSLPSPYMMYIVIVNEGIFYAQNLQCYSSIGNVTPADLSNTESLQVRDVVHNNFYGSGFMDSVRNGIGKVTGVYNRIAPYVEGIPAVKTFGNILRGTNALVGNGKKGGALMSFSELRKRARSEAE